MKRNNQSANFISKKILFPSEIKSLALLGALLNDLNNVLSDDENVFSNITICLNEAITNAIVHGNKENKANFVKLEMILIHQTNWIFKITDEGDGFNPAEISKPTETENLEKIGGRGVYIMKKLADFCIFNRLGNEVTLYFKI
jgi:serine/threonine-protein kinase RsbW